MMDALTATQPCPGCGAEGFHTAYSGPVGARMARTGECWTCAFWESRCEAGEDLVIDGHVYGVGKEPREGEPRDFLGMAGRRFDIEVSATGERFTTHNLWSGGEIPDRFRERLPNTARFLGGSKEDAGGTTCWNPASERNPRLPVYSKAGKP